MGLSIEVSILPKPYLRAIMALPIIVLGLVKQLFLLSTTGAWVGVATAITGSAKHIHGDRLGTKFLSPITGPQSKAGISFSLPRICACGLWN